MKAVISLMNRNRKLFFRDKGMFFSALITPFILIVLYAPFLAKVYKDSFTSAFPEGFTIAEKLIDGTVASQLVAALLAVSCVTVTFCVNLTMVQDKVNGIRKDLNVSPISRSKIYLGYFLATVLNSLLVNGLALVIGLLYIGKMGWYLSFVDVLWIIIDEILLVLFGSTLSSIISYPLTTQGQMSAVGTIVSAGYGFICGAYMPISNFGSGLQKALSYLPLIGQRVYTHINPIGQRRWLMNYKFYALPVEKQSQILNAAYKVFAMNQYKKAPTSEIAAEAGISKSLLFHYFHNKQELYIFLWNHAADLTKKYMCKYKVYETDDFFEMMRRGLMAKCAVMRKYTFLSLFSINSYFETEPDIQSTIQPYVQDVTQTTLELLLSILNLDFIRKDIEFVRIYKEILYASEGMLKHWYRTGNYDVTVFEQKYLEMINHWEMVYGKGKENDRKQL